ncbi:zinc finger, c2h2 type domain-containing protein [Besnoitia besnoiti]|uniref:Zinc finger, c2h2 type domain-containing protein n=1 Tax=Besnoitia besnoiti TaxID=94643 RepID=A0A2A9MIC7_BESBE|nr:zinc finger, c2h2 type domain-containing protein [Besnoitia besnoiti]PFH36011.1 zinc finger, c2h2 type domain-containing protein [Besnoitia besnoiti]
MHGHLRAQGWLLPTVLLQGAKLDQFAAAARGFRYRLTVRHNAASELQNGAHQVLQSSPPVPDIPGGLSGPRAVSLAEAASEEFFPPQRKGQPACSRSKIPSGRGTAKGGMEEGGVKKAMADKEFLSPQSPSAVQAGLVESGCAFGKEVATPSSTSTSALDSSSHPRSPTSSLAQSPKQPPHAFVCSLSSSKGTDGAEFSFSVAGVTAFSTAPSRCFSSGGGSPPFSFSPSASSLGEVAGVSADLVLPSRKQADPFEECNSFLRGSTDRPSPPEALACAGNSGAPNGARSSGSPEACVRKCPGGVDAEGAVEAGCGAGAPGSRQRRDEEATLSPSSGQNSVEATSAPFEGVPEQPSKSVWQLTQELMERFAHLEARGREDAASRSGGGVAEDTRWEAASLSMDKARHRSASGLGLQSSVQSDKAEPLHPSHVQDSRFLSLLKQIQQCLRMSSPSGAPAGGHYTSAMEEWTSDTPFKAVEAPSAGCDATTPERKMKQSAVEESRMQKEAMLAKEQQGRQLRIATKHDAIWHLSDLVQVAANTGTAKASKLGPTEDAERGESELAPPLKGNRPHIDAFAADTRHKDGVAQTPGVAVGSESPSDSQDDDFDWYTHTMAKQRRRKSSTSCSEGSRQYGENGSFSFEKNHLKGHSADLGPNMETTEQLFFTPTRSVGCRTGESCVASAHGEERDSAGIVPKSAPAAFSADEDRADDKTPIRDIIRTFLSRHFTEGSASTPSSSVSRHSSPAASLPPLPASPLLSSAGDILMADMELSLSTGRLASPTQCGKASEEKRSAAVARQPASRSVAADGCSGYASFSPALSAAESAMEIASGQAQQPSGMLPASGDNVRGVRREAKHPKGLLDALDLPAKEPCRDERDSSPPSVSLLLSFLLTARAEKHQEEQRMFLAGLQTACAVLRGREASAASDASGPSSWLPAIMANVTSRPDGKLEKSAAPASRCSQRSVLCQGSTLAPCETRRGSRSPARESAIPRPPTKLLSRPDRFLTTPALVLTGSDAPVEAGAAYPLPAISGLSGESKGLAPSTPERQKESRGSRRSSVSACEDDARRSRGDSSSSERVPSPFSQPSEKEGSPNSLYAQRRVSGSPFTKYEGRASERVAGTGISSVCRRRRDSNTDSHTESALLPSSAEISLTRKRRQDFAEATQIGELYNTNAKRKALLSSAKMSARSEVGVAEPRTLLTTACFAGHPQGLDELSALFQCGVPQKVMEGIDARVGTKSAFVSEGRPSEGVISSGAKQTEISQFPVKNAETNVRLWRFPAAAGFASKDTAAMWAQGNRRERVSPSGLETHIPTERGFTESGKTQTASGTGEKRGHRPTAKKERSEGRVYACPLCHGSFSRNYNLHHHMRAVHEGAKPFVCPICQKTFSYKRGNLEQHIQAVHRGQKPFQCKICNRTFSQKGNLSQHIQAVHAGNRPFQCPQCARAFSRKSHLHRHVTSLKHFGPGSPVATEESSQDTAAAVHFESAAAARVVDSAI